MHFVPRFTERLHYIRLLIYPAFPQFLVTKSLRFCVFFSSKSVHMASYRGVYLDKSWVSRRKFLMHFVPFSKQVLQNQLVGSKLGLRFFATRNKDSFHTSSFLFQNCSLSRSKHYIRTGSSANRELKCTSNFENIAEIRLTILHFAE